jgi:tetratricopeptide (TPR) repeat protein
MTDVPPQVPEDERPGTTAPHRRAARSSALGDPVVMRMVYVALGLLVLFLLTIVGALTSGVINPTAPRTLAEKELTVSRTEVQQGSTDPAVWGRYIASLIGTGQYGRAKRVIADGRASIDDSATADFALAEARLYSAQKQHEKALDAADGAIKQIETARKDALAAGGAVAAAAEREGLPENYYIAVLLKAEAFRALGQTDKAIEQYGIYIAANEGAADILVERGDAKADMGDKAGAESDYREALRFVPDSKTALDGLKKIGVAR